MAFTQGHIVTLGETHEHGDVFFCCMPLTKDISVPRKSGHRQPSSLIDNGSLRVCPDFRGLPVHHIEGMRQKKTSSCSFTS